MAAFERMTYRALGSSSAELSRRVAVGLQRSSRSARALGRSVHLTSRNSEVLRGGSHLLGANPRRSRGRSLMARADSGMHIPSDSFGGLSPEKKAADALRTLFTFVAARVVLSQLESSGRGSHETGNADAYEVLSSHLTSVPMKDGDKWLSELMVKNKLLGYRISEVREAYSKEEFQWGQVKKLARTETKESNVNLLRSTMESTTQLDTLAEHPCWPGPSWMEE